ncbi:3'a2rel-related protein, putative [Trypanosoma cruzi]|uniref:Putative 3'a2rel-related protein n=1 Tax=Trypanosoma cruzi TaxID=5693 RepID=A0A2V2UW49_TRYCR|nr:3'a2rel-related protein, putative [Trypanosoma cruzi]KAF8280639.1 putative 3'a2rel-related protein [Trypanosoma cruzi]PWU88300.1 putative 3'a2rel-related protein [Trypanosoma cruzi]
MGMLPESQPAEANNDKHFKSDKKDDSDFLLLLLLLLIFPVAFLAYFLTRYCRNYSFRRLARRIKLWGSGQPGDVDALGMGRAIGGGEWLTERKRQEGNPVEDNNLLLDLSKPVEEFDPISAEAEKHKKRWQRSRDLGDAESYNTEELNAEKDATADATDDGAAARGSPGSGAYDAATTRVWLRNLVSGTYSNADGTGVVHDVGAVPKTAATDQSGETGAGRQLYKASSGDGQQGQFLRGGSTGRSFEEILASLAPAIHEKGCAKKEGPAVTSEADEEVEEEDEEEEGAESSVFSRR